MSYIFGKNLSACILFRDTLSINVLMYFFLLLVDIIFILNFKKVFLS